MSCEVEPPDEEEEPEPLEPPSPPIPPAASMAFRSTVVLLTVIVYDDIVSY